MAMCPNMVDTHVSNMSVCVSVSFEEIRYIGLGLTFMTSFNLDHLFKEPSPNVAVLQDIEGSVCEVERT